MLAMRTTVTVIVIGVAVQNFIIRKYKRHLTDLRTDVTGLEVSVDRPSLEGRQGLD